jgi:hypothetical protein
MRLTPRQIQAIKQAVADHFGANAQVWLFGSRTDDKRRGGDFDFYVETDLDDPAEVIDRKLRALAQIHATPEFEDEKIDLVIKPAIAGPYPPIYERARQQGVRL